MATIKIILVQSRNTEEAFQYRIAKLVGAVYVETIGRKVHVGDVLKEAEAKDLASSKRYEVTVTEKGGER
jgi:hypothetical protein